MSDDTIELDREQYEEFMSVLDGVLDSIYGNGYDEQVKRLDDLREAMEPDDRLGDDKRVSRGHIEFDGMTQSAFRQLVRETLRTSAFIEVDYDGVIYEVAGPDADWDPES